MAKKKAAPKNGAVVKFSKAAQAGRSAPKKVSKTHRAPAALATREAFSLGGCGLVIKGNPTYEEWAAYLSKLTNIGNATNFALGDMLIYAETRNDWAEIWAQAIDETQKSVDSLQTCRNVATKFTLDRRWATLSFGHHREVAPLPEIDQDKWLKIADDECLSVKQLRERMKGAKDSAKLPLEDDEPTPQVVGIVLIEQKVHSTWETEGLANREMSRLKREGGKSEVVVQRVRTKAEAVAEDDAEGF